MKNVIKEEPFIIDNNEFKKITYDNGEQIYKGLDKQFNAWVTLRFKSTDDEDVISEIKNMTKLLM